ncbi:hypothetical protein BOTBODRAFT_271091 [Botryobasidium botryosum FD-172 SS1]|uniref:Uncharacterized protein n=1 Tax=Botryobasidium botryosum (strain FD-172 SS1) TaxID=930990 RepID=A0A067LSQ0_BOTB1|nr:hypothetical protein BOTBODRAFT_271091 [Botryobasidium botryosum FD-172 SS1]
MASQSAASEDWQSLLAERGGSLLGLETSIRQADEMEDARRRGRTLRYKYVTGTWREGECDMVSAAVMQQARSMRSRNKVDEAVERIPMGNEKTRGAGRGSHIVLPDTPQAREPIFCSLALPEQTADPEGEALVDAFEELGASGKGPGTRSENEALHLLVWSKSALFPFLTRETRDLLADVQSREALVKLVALVKNVSARVMRVMLELDPAYATAAQQICDYALAYYQKVDSSFDPDLGGLATALAAKVGGSPYAHLDHGDWRKGLAVLYVIGPFTGGDFVLPQMGIAIPFGALTVLLVRASELIHFVGELQGCRVILTTFIDLHTAVHAGSEEAQFWEAPEAAAALGAAKDALAAACKEVEALRRAEAGARTSKQNRAAKRNACQQTLCRAQKKLDAGRKAPLVPKLVEEHRAAVAEVDAAESSIQELGRAIRGAQEVQRLRAVDVAVAEDALDDAKIRYHPWLKHIHTPTRLLDAAVNILAKRRGRIRDAEEALRVTLSGATGEGVKTECEARAALQTALEAVPFAMDQIAQTRAAKAAGAAAHHHWHLHIYPFEARLAAAHRAVRRQGKVLIDATAAVVTAARSTSGSSLEEGQRLEFEAIATRRRAFEAKARAEHAVARLAEELQVQQERCVSGCGGSIHATVM